MNHAAATITPVSEPRQCTEPGCDVAELLARVDPDADGTDTRVLCPTHRVEYLRQVSDL
ncbi:hypothetical protein RBH20_09830 [Haloarcula sp. H-GB4]|uniref:hypothetical protein n=1 Tax=Haloarcula sp. H-GB4 TaxID=3069755 RepID=UPI0027B66F17|nr:hypothetical protein [Haloarcula sp. H-GB4]MDQ2072833.1 hypothetical protein [Haloarcula sp. H-GB4]